MIHELNKADYYRVRPLFQPLRVSALLRRRAARQVSWPGVC